MFRTIRWRIRTILNHVPGLEVFQNGWTLGHKSAARVSVSRRHRGAKFGCEYHRPRSLDAYRYLQVSWSNPREHKWWARSITLYWRERSHTPVPYWKDEAHSTTKRFSI